MRIVAMAGLGLLAACAAEDVDHQAVAASDQAISSKVSPQARDAALDRIKKQTGGDVLISTHKATGSARVLRIKPDSSAALASGTAKSAADQLAASSVFFRDNGAAVGVGRAADMRLVKAQSDSLGQSHLSFRQYYGNVPVFGATLRTHFDKSGKLKSVAGTAIPDIDVSTDPLWSRDEAAAIARQAVAAERGDSDYLHPGASTLYIYREGLAQGVPGPNHLAWEVEVTDDAGVRDLVYVSAATGKVIDRVTAVEEALSRRAYDGKNLPRVPDNYPNGPYWVEGQRFPTLVQEANNMIIASKETYDFYRNTFGRDSFDGAGAKMDAIFNRGYSCPNASWNGTFISFCPGLTVDDVTAHEWSHAYTEYTHHLIYQWQPGALNESYSDIFGETVDRINGRGNDDDATLRTNACSTSSPPVGTLRINAPDTIDGDYFAQSAGFGPALSTTGVTGKVVAALDAADAAGPSTFDACSAITNAADVAGNVALVNRGTCEFSTKVLNAQNAGAVAVIVANNAPTGLPGMGAGAVAAQVTIPSLGVQQSTGTAIRNQLATLVDVNATLLARPGTDASVRWLLGEDSTGGIQGALRDMWNPGCYSNPGKVSDTAYYVCNTVDGGGVHTNSGVPNHGYALLVDGGTYNGTTVTGIGLSKAAQIYFRAESVYQVDDTDFADHADALEASCADLVTGGKAGPTLGSDTLNGPMTPNDCAQVSAMIAAVELRKPPTFCNFPTLLDPRTASLCSSSTTTGGATAITGFDFEAGADGWTATTDAASATFTPREWTRVTALPDRAGAGFFAATPDNGTCKTTDESGVMHLTSPPITIPASASFARATFEHWMSSEAGFDGGNLKVSVNNGPWQLLNPSQFSFNSYNALLFTAADGNTNPLAGQPAWTGTNQGTVNGGSWGRTHVDLGNLAKPGDTVQLRWDLGTDGCSARIGWYLDNVNVFSCTPNVPVVNVSDASGAEAGGSIAFRILLSAPTIRPVAVTVETVDGTAGHGNDYDRTVGTVVIPASTATALSGGVILRVPVKDDIVSEGDETFTLRILDVQNATLGDGEAIGTIVDDDVGQGN